MAMKQDYVASEEEGPRTFYLQYSFPPSSVGETGRVGAPGRREVGHGMLAERALQPVIPDEAMFDIMDPSTISQAAYGAVFCNGQTLGRNDHWPPPKHCDPSRQVQVLVCVGIVPLHNPSREYNH